MRNYWCCVSGFHLLFDIVSVSIPNPQNPEEPKNLSSIIYVFLRGGREWGYLDSYKKKLLGIWLLGLINNEVASDGSVFVCLYELVFW